MIPTRVHGMIDYGVSAVMGALAVGSSLPRPVRQVLGGAAAFHTGYSVLTDYEGGLRPAIDMRAHLELDAAGAVALAGAALMMNRQPMAIRAGLFAAAAAELAVVAFSSTEPARGPGQGHGAIDRLIGHAGPDRAYTPLDTLKHVAQDVFLVDSTMRGPLGVVLPVRMTVIRLPNGDLLVHSPTRLSLKLKLELEERGPVRHLVAPSMAHWVFMPDWQQAYPEATTWAAPGLRSRRQVRNSGLRLDRDIPEGVIADWGEAIRIIDIPGGMGFHECALFHQPTSTLVLTDLAMNMEASRLPPILRTVLRLMGSTEPDGMPPPYLRALIKRQAGEAARAAERLLALQPERVIFAHGAWFQRDGTMHLRRSFRWLLPAGQGGSVQAGQYAQA